MCGIAGYWGGDQAEGYAAVVAMNRAQEHRGPDDEGIQHLPLAGGSLVFGHRRLAVLDLSSAGHQPMENPNTGDWITYNGELFNYRELRSELENSGYQFRTRTDTEAILLSFQRWGLECFSRFYGMFAFGLYSARDQTLLLARDHLGIKPLYYCWAGNAFAFASEVKALVASKTINGSMDRRGIATLLAYGAIQAPATIFQNVAALEPGSWVSLNLCEKKPFGILKCKQHWKYPYPSVDSKWREDEFARLRQALSDSIRSHLLSDVPVGVFLSSGLDSTAVAALCKHVGAKVDTFTVGLASDPEFDESGIAERTSAALGFRHHKVSLPEEDARSLVAKWIAGLDQPSLDGLNTFIISKAVRDQGIVVALSGLGGDEVFCGYETFYDVPSLLRMRRLSDLLPRRARKAIVGALFGFSSPARRAKAIELSDTEISTWSLYFRRKRLLSDRELQSLGMASTALDLGDEFLGDESRSDCYEERDVVAAIGFLETNYYLTNTLLRDADVQAMANGLEIRVPLLDRRVLELVLGAPGSQRVGSSRDPKPLLRKALGELIPRNLVGLPKRGFSLPHSRWMRDSLRKYFEAGIDHLGKTGLVDPEGLWPIWRGFLKYPDSPDWSRAWMLGVLGHWTMNLDRK